MRVVDTGVHPTELERIGQVVLRSCVRAGLPAERVYCRLVDDELRLSVVLRGHLHDHTLLSSTLVDTLCGTLGFEAVIQVQD